MKEKIKILFVDHTPFPGGAQLCLASHIKYLDRAKFKPFLLIDRHSKYTKIYSQSNVDIIKINFGQLKSWDFFLNLKKSLNEFSNVINKINPDVVLANTTRALVISALAKKNFKLISYIRDYDYPKWLFKLIKKRADLYLTVSKSINNFYNLDSKVVYLGSDIYKKKISKTEINSYKRKLGIKEGDLVIGYSGRLVKWKGADILIEAFKKININNVKLILFGTGENQQGSIEEELKKNQDENIIFAGFINNSIAYGLMDIFVLPSVKDEPFSTSVIEAAFFSLPIIATRTGGTPEFIKHEKNGLLILPDNTNLLAKALVRLIKDRNLAKKLAANAYSDAQEFQEKVLAGKLEKIYKQIL